jgi:hypothetical protein
VKVELINLFQSSISEAFLEFLGFGDHISKIWSLLFSPLVVD